MDAFILCILYIALTIGIVLLVGKVCTISTTRLSPPAINVTISNNEDDIEGILRLLMLQNPGSDILIHNRDTNEETKKIVELLAKDYPQLQVLKDEQSSFAATAL
ncbi:MAG: hypothetical protein E7397_02875 [Ruminococcaceae bacterium]|nr:hypothetical protein [Oscillospiraceae bacterium]